MVSRQEEPNEDFPLLPSTSFAPQKASSRQYDGAMLKLEQMNDFEEYEDDEEEDKILFADKKKRGLSLICCDAVLLLLQTIQLFAVIQSLALRWPWPYNWLKYTNPIFLFNADVWEFMKIQTNGTYKNVQGYYTPSGSVPLDYWHILLAWACFVFLLLVVFIVTYIVIVSKKHPYMFLQISHLQRAYIIIAQVIAIPIGTVIARIFHCTDLDLVDVSNDLKCYKAFHWAYIGPMLAFAFLFYILFPAWLIIRTKSEILSMTPDRHEGYLQLKETEYVQGLDVQWVIGGFHIFASYKKCGAHMKAGFHIFIAIILILYAALPGYILEQAITVTLILSLACVIFLILRPFRLTVFNYMLFVCLFCLSLDGMMGCLITSFQSSTVQTVWLTPYYMTIVLTIINSFWALAALVFVIYLIARQMDCCKRCCPISLWPSMTSEGLNRLTPQTRKYVRSVLKGRVLLERCLAMHPMFAPAHELSRYIHIVNAFCREAEYLRDPIHDALWDLLDELIEAHSQIAPKSLFAESVKDSIRMTAGDFMKMMPMFVRRLAQREYDFILVNPVKKRLLLKMYCMGLFLNGRREKVERQRLTLPAVQKVWKKKEQKLDEFEDDGYYEDMYPEYESGPTYRPTTTMYIDVGLVNDQELDDEVAIEEAEQWAADHPLSRKGYSNQGYEDDLSEIFRDDVSVNLSQMLEDVPDPLSMDSAGVTAAGSRPGTARSEVGRPSSVLLMTPNVSNHENLSDMPRNMSPQQASSHSGSGTRSLSPVPTIDTNSPAGRLLSADTNDGTALSRPSSAQSIRSVQRPGSASPRTASPRQGPNIEDVRGSGPLPGQAEDVGQGQSEA